MDQLLDELGRQVAMEEVEWDDPAGISGGKQESHVYED
jgi:hypothetical protein